MHNLPPRPTLKTEKMQIGLTNGIRYQILRGLSVLRLSPKMGMQEEKPVFCTLEADMSLEIVGSWLKAPSMSKVECGGALYAVFTEDLQERVRPIDHAGGSIVTKTAEHNLS
jgi:hypothetical protein